jgi:anti-sigma factor RsiW
MPEMIHATTLLEDYSLGLLEPQQLLAVEAHVATCPRCQAEIRKLDAVLVTWADSVAELQPSPQPWSQLQARLQVDRAAQSDDATTGVPVTVKTQTRESQIRDPQTPEPISDLLPEIATADVYFEPPLTRTVIPPLPLAGAWFATTFSIVLALGSLFWGWRTQSALQVAQTDKQLVADFLAKTSLAKDSGSLALFDPADKPLGTVLVAGQEALFVLTDSAPQRTTYQAWGHVNDDWTPGSTEQLTSLEISNDGVFKVSTAGFAALYLSLEPPGGSPQPTHPLTRVSLQAPVSETPITISSPSSGSVVASNSVIVQGNLSTAVRGLSYSLNGGDEIIASFTGTRFTFTLSGLQTGENRLELRAKTVNGETTLETLTLTYQP